MVERLLEYYSATPEEIREDLGLEPDATQSEVVAERWRRFDSERFVRDESELEASGSEENATT